MVKLSSHAGPGAGMIRVRTGTVMSIFSSEIERVSIFSQFSKQIGV